MYYSDLLNIKRDRGDKVSIVALRSLELKIPDDVLEQFCSDHATKNEFQEQYGQLNLEKISWELRSFKAGDLVLVNIYHRFRNWTKNVELRLQHFDSDSWNCIDTRKAVIDHWTTNRTWLRPPILLDGLHFDLPGQLHLVEGHTRIGILRGLVLQGIVSADSMHEAWIGTES